MSQPLIDQALGALSLGKVEEAEALARRAVDAAPDRAETWRALGLIHQTCRRYHDAFDAFERALGLSPEDDGVAAALSALASRVGMKDAALALAMHVAQRRPGDVLATVALGDALLALDHVSQACDLAETALSRASRAYEGFLPPPLPGQSFEDRAAIHAETFIKRGESGASLHMATLFNPDYILKNDLVFIGSAKTVAEKLHKAAETGVFNTFMGEFNFADLPEDDLMRSIRLFGEKVIPELRDFEPY